MAESRPFDLPLGSALSELNRDEEAIAAYDRAIEIKKDDYQAWSNRSNVLVKLNKLEEAMDDISTAISFAPEPELQVRPYLIRSYINHLVERYSDAADDLVTAWRINPDEVIDDLEHGSFIEFLCLKTQSPETTLLLTELYSAQAAAAAASSGASGDAKLKASRSIDVLCTLKPLNTVDAPQIAGSISGELAYDVLTRSATRLFHSGDAALARECIEKMQSWVLTIFNEDFDSLTNLMQETS